MEQCVNSTENSPNPPALSASSDVFIKDGTFVTINELLLICCY